MQKRQEATKEMNNVEDNQPAINILLMCNHIIGYSEGVDEAWLVYADAPDNWCYKTEVFKYCPRCGIEIK